MMFELAESDDLSQEAPIPIAFDFVGQPGEEGAVPLEHFQEPAGGGQSDAFVVALVWGGIDFGDKGGVLWVITARVSRDPSVRKFFDPVCRLEEIVLNGDDEAGGEPIAVEGEALGTFFSGTVVPDAGFHVLQTAVLTSQQLTLYSPFSLEPLSFLGVVPLPSSDCFNQTLGDPHDRREVSLSNRQRRGRGPWGDSLDFGGRETSAGWRRSRGFGFHVDRLVGHALIAVGVVKGAAEVFAEV